jgi:hypothetical protein
MNGVAPVEPAAPEDVFDAPQARSPIAHVIAASAIQGRWCRLRGCVFVRA